MSAEFAFHCEPACVGEARAWLDACLRTALQHRAVADVVADALVIASELVTNAINSPCATGRLGWRTGTSWLRLWVFDDGPGWPVVHDPGPLESHGRGLHIVRALAGEFGARPVYGGKEVWAVLALS